ncbi:MgtC/SapB family protein [Pullulanibacillus sp. KACC 23026]|uniref:MgtC/SapB family protein n=1 Tax=Pullulanibacillus sp. KACC 23026 TaxID=3028315 RepID=UPI0023AFA2BD|nr:MgtC/SapB family protein [Pullulanibacillus sp. KACC 23026]WEG12939.1 MgtC/SapB family protein [Pullulanibacillus sp. KACC 23026]
MMVWAVPLKLVVAALLGGILGLERESKHKPLGLKTCIVISVASCLLTIVSIEVSVSHYTNTLIRVDPMRLAAQIVSGVGFIGAGVILQKNDAISGLTTAAIVWAASGLGIAVGAGFYYESVLGVLLIFLGVKVIPFIMKKIGPDALREQGIKIILYDVESADLIQPIVEEIRQLNIRTKQVKLSGTETGHRIDLHCMISETGDYVFAIYDKVIKIPGVKRAQIEEL